MTNPPRVLIVDDHPINRRLPALLLGEHGWECSEAADGEEALRKLATMPYDVVLLDLGLPGLSGYEVCRRIRADASLRHIRVIAYSALAASELDVINAGFDALCGKPLSRDLLLALVNKDGEDSES
jgi:CheY-like chemotaxis protein